jgi:hypothetical protein
VPHPFARLPALAAQRLPRFISAMAVIFETAVVARKFTKPPYARNRTGSTQAVRMTSSDVARSRGSAGADNGDELQAGVTPGGGDDKA